MTVNVLQRSSCNNHFTFKGQNCKSLISIKKIEFWLLDIFVFINNIGAVILCRHLNLKNKKNLVWRSVEAFRWVCGRSWQTCFYTNKHTPDSIKLPFVHTVIYLAESQVIAWDFSTWDKHTHSQQPLGQCAVGCNSLDSEKGKKKKSVWRTMECSSSFCFQHTNTHSQCLVDWTLWSRSGHLWQTHCIPSGWPLAINKQT